MCPLRFQQSHQDFKMFWLNILVWFVNSLTLSYCETVFILGRDVVTLPKVMWSKSLDHSKCLGWGQLECCNSGYDISLLTLSFQTTGHNPEVWPRSEGKGWNLSSAHSCMALYLLIILSERLYFWAHNYKLWAQNATRARGERMLCKQSVQLEHNGNILWALKSICARKISFMRSKFIIVRSKNIIAQNKFTNVTPCSCRSDNTTPSKIVSQIHNNAYNTYAR